MKPFRLLIIDRAGATSIEYGIIAALMALVIIASIAVMGDPVKGLFGGVSDKIIEVNERLENGP